MKLHLIIIIFLLVASKSNANRIDVNVELYSSSVQGLLKLLDMENQFVFNMIGYADALQEKIETLQAYLKVFDRAVHATDKGKDRFISNPINAFGLIRRLRQDWRQLQVYTKADVGKDNLKAMRAILGKSPTKKDMNESLLAINRIELTYDLNPMDMAEGHLLGKQFDHKLSMRDCLSIANHKYELGDYARAIIWYRTALKRQPEPHPEAYSKLFKGSSLDTVRQKLAESHLLQDIQRLEPSLNRKEQLDKLKQTLKKYSAKQLKTYIDKLLKNDYDQLLGDLRSQQPKATSHYLGCRGRFPKRTSLSCRYNFTTTAFLRLAPLKMEEINHDPYIVMYHNVLSNEEIEEIKGLAIDMHNGFADAFKENLTEIPYIIARFKWLVESTPLLKRINERITDMTGFDVADFPAIQVANYGIGSYFKPHYDYIYGDRVRKEGILHLGDRMASLIFYASDVPLGGATIFPDMQVAVPPQKGNSLFWYNLFDDGTQDPRSLHSVCPVVVGSRWTLTKWLHMTSQMFRKPCTSPH